MSVVYIKINGKFQPCFDPLITFLKRENLWYVWWQDHNGTHQQIVDKIYTEEEYARQVRNAD